METEHPNRPVTLWQRLYQWLDARVGLSPYQGWIQKKVVPVHRQSFWYYMGGIALLFIGIQVVTGMLLMVYYIPEMKAAHASVLTLNSQVDFGWFIRSFHAWGSNLLVLVLFLHLFSTYWMKAYRPPRELTWWTGLLLLAVVFGFGFSGYLLPWDEVSLFATKIGLDIATKVPWVGEPIAFLLRGGPTISGATLSRFFALHVMVLPLLTLPLLGLHLFLIQVHGMSEPGWFRKLPPAKRVYESFFPTFLLKDTMGWLLVLNLTAILVALFPWSLGEVADPFKPAPVGIKPEWYFLALFQFFKLLPGHIGPLEGEQVGLILFGLVVLSIILVPLWDRGNLEWNSQVARGYGLLLILLLVGLTVWGWLS